MSHDDDFELFQQMMGDVKPINQDTAEHKKVHQVTDAHIAKREAAIWLTEDDPEYLSLDHAEMLKPDTSSSSNEMVFKMVYFANFALGSTLSKPV